MAAAGAGAAAAAAAAGAGANNFPTTCDIIGYTNHANTCWSDTIQELVFFSDPLKQKTQRKALELMELSPIELKSRIHLIIDSFNRDLMMDYLTIEPKSNSEPKSVIELETFKTSFTNFVINVLKRFKNHYNYLNHLPIIKEEGCALYREKVIGALNESSKLKRALSQETGTGAGKVISQTFRGVVTKANGTISHGLEFERYLILYVFLLSLFGIDPIVHYDSGIYEFKSEPAPTFHFAHYSGKLYDFTKDPGYTKEVNEFKKTLNRKDFSKENYVRIINKEAKSIKKKYGSGHSCGVFECNGSWYYYDSNLGLIPLPKSMKMESIAEMTGVFYTMGAEKILPYKDNNMIDTPDMVWYDGSWKSWADLTLQFMEDKDFKIFFYTKYYSMNAEEAAEAFMLEPSPYFYTIKKYVWFHMEPASKGGARKTRRRRSKARKTRRLRKLK